MQESSINGIPKVIHYCWFGGKPLPELARKCIDSWRRFCPDYEIRQWDESNFDVQSCDYVKEAYAAKKWAFVSDYARFWILYNHGGVYFDTDVELLKPIDPILEKGGFMGVEVAPGDFVGGNADLIVAPGLGIAVAKNDPFYERILKYYQDIHFMLSDGSLNTMTVGSHVTELLRANGLKNEDVMQTVCGINIYPKRFFNPIDLNSGKCKLTDDTVSIHHYAATWVSGKTKFRDGVFRFIYRVFGKRVAEALKKAYRNLSS